jgi:hypothetical protein
MPNATDTAFTEQQLRTDWSAESLAVLANALIIFISHFIYPKN